MANGNEKIIRVRLFTWFERVPNQVQPGGDPVLVERISHFGADVDLTNCDPVYLQRGVELGAFYSDEEAAAIRDGSYSGPDRELLFNARAGIRPARVVEDADDEHGDVSMMSAEQLGEHINDRKLSVPDTLSLLPEDADVDTIQKFIDAENFATDNEPRKGVMDKLEAQLSARSQTEPPKD